MTPISSSRLRADVVRLLLVYGSLALLLVAARGPSAAVSHGQMIDGALSRAGSMIGGLAHAGTTSERLPSILAPLVGTADRSTDSDDDDDDDGNDGTESRAAGSSRDTSGSLNNGRLAGIDPAHSRPFDNLPRRAPPL